MSHNWGGNARQHVGAVTLLHCFVDGTLSHIHIYFTMVHCFPKRDYLLLRNVNLFGTFSCQSIESNNIDLKMDTHLIVLKILVTFCLVMHTVLSFQIYLVRKGNIKSIVITQNITGILLPAIEITIITFFLKNVLFCEEFSISWSFYIFCRTCFICVIIFLTHAIKRFIAYENSHCIENEVFH